MPRVSVIMPVHNGERFVSEAITSILRQTFSDFEFLIVDDGSTDSTPSILRSFHDPRIRLLTNDRQRGIVGALNRALAEARGTYIARMDADDRSAPDRLERQTAFLDREKDVALVGTAAVLIDEQGRERGRESHPAGAREIRKTIFVHNPFIHGSVAVRKSVLDECGVYDERFLHNEDYDLWLRICARHASANLPEFLLERRIHPESITSAKQRELVRYRFRTLFHAIRAYERKPLYLVYLIRPMAACVFRRLGGDAPGHS